MAASTDPEHPLAKWTQVANLHAIDGNHKLQYGAEVFPSGKLFNTITHGVRNMAGYEGQIPVADRWAIVAYIRALQLSQQASINDVPPEARNQLGGAK